MHTIPHTPTTPTGVPRDPDALVAQDGWSRADAEKAAAREGLRLTDEHWRVVQALREYYARHEAAGLPIHLRDLHDALEEAFHAEGGLRHLYALFPGGPVAQGCRIAGLKPPFIACDTGFGSVA